MVNQVVRRHLNRQAAIVGLIGLVCYLGLGYFLKIKLMYDYDNWTQNFAVLRKGLKYAHVHGLSLSFMLLFYAFFVELAGIEKRLKEISSYLAITGVILIPITFLISGFGIQIALLNHVAAVMVVSSAGILAWAYIKK